jgi:hypothetical protein
MIQVIVRVERSWNSLYLIPLIGEESIRVPYGQILFIFPLGEFTAGLAGREDSLTKGDVLWIDRPNAPGICFANKAEDLFYLFQDAVPRHWLLAQLDWIKEEKQAC